MSASILLMLFIRFYTPLAWTWYVLIGSLTTFAVAWLASFIFDSERKNVGKNEISI
jgi:hypothetical protein